MQIELTSPCCLRLGYVRAGQADAAIGELGIALQHPQIQMVARPAAQLTVSGARAEMAYQQAQAASLIGNIEIEIAIPAYMGLSSDEMLLASMKRVQSLWHGIPAGIPAGTPTHFRMTLPQRAFAQGGLLLNDDDGLLRARATLPHDDETEDWVFVLVLPKEPDNIADDFEAKQVTALQQAIPHLSTECDATALFAAVERRDFTAFADELVKIHEMNAAALAVSGHPVELTAEDRDILGVMAANGAVICQRTLTGLGLYGLIKGGAASRQLRAALTQHLSYFGPLVMATICDNEGAQIKQIN